MISPERMALIVDLAAVAAARLVGIEHGRREFDDEEFEAFLTRVYELRYGKVARVAA